MNVGDYVRTDRGYIIKISDFKEHYTKGKRLGLKEEVVENFLLLDDKQCEIIESIDYSIPPCYPSDEELEKIKSHIIKSSPNIIDLVEYMDLLWLEHPIKLYDSDTTISLFNPVRCDGFTTFEDGTHCIILNLDYIVDIKDLKIKGIITHEQIESMEYKVKE